MPMPGPLSLWSMPISCASAFSPIRFHSIRSNERWNWPSARSRLSPDAPLGYQALHLAFWLRRDVEQSFAAARAGLARDPNNPELLADLGGRLCLRRSSRKAFRF